MFWTLTVRRLADVVASGFPKRFGSRPDLETGRRLVAVATEGGIVVAVSEPPPSKARAAATVTPPPPAYRSTPAPPLH
jgi:hypothetical protein